MLFKVFKIFASNIFSFNGLLSESEKKSKIILRAVLIGITFLYIAVIYGAMYIYTMITTYKNLKITGQTELMPVICFVMASVLVFVIGFLSVANNYFTGKGEEELLSMPLKPVEIFGAKIGVSFITDSILGMLILAAGGVIFGYNEGLLSNPSFYVGLLVSVLTVSIVLVYIIYLLLVLVLFFIPALRKKSLLNWLAIFSVLIFVSIYSFLSTRVDFASNSEQNMKNAVLLANLARRLVNTLPFIKWLSSALIGDWAAILMLTVTFILVTFAFIPLTATLYVRTLNGFTDVKTKKLSEVQAEKILKRDAKAGSVTKALFLRDVRTVFREPTFFSNGPLALVLLPLIILISFWFGVRNSGGMELSDLRFKLSVFFLSADFITLEKVRYFIILGGSAAAIFLANSTNVASTSFSREGKAFYCLKAMPIKKDSIIFVKFIHAFLYSIIAFFIVALQMLFAAAYLQIPFSVKEKLLIFFSIFIIESLFSSILIFLEMLIDTLHPKLEWENPVAAFKQNLNTIFSIFLTMGLIVLFLLLGIIVFPKNNIGLIILILFLILIAIPLGLCYWKYAVKKIDRM